MFSIALKGLRYNKDRYIATVIAIIVGVSFFASSGFLGDRIIDSIEGDTKRQYSNVDVAITPSLGSPEDEEDGVSVATASEDSIRIPEDAAQKLSGIEGVSDMAEVLTGSLSIYKDSDDETEAVTGRLWVQSEELNPLSIVEGKAPLEANEIGIDRALADKLDLKVGDKASVVSFQGANLVTVSTITEFGSKSSIDPSGTVSLPRATAFDWLANGSVEFQEIYLQGSVSQAELSKSAEEIIPAGYQAQEGDAFLRAKVKETSLFGDVIKKSLQAFAVLSVLVGSFVIYNTFSVIVSQRVKELAVLRAIGATSKQVKRSLRIEGLLLGLVGSILGIVTGVGLVYVFDFILSGLFNFELPGSGVTINSGVIIWSMVLGTTSTYLSVMVPARRASKTEPIEALRSSAVETSPISKKRIIASTVMLVAGLLLVLAGSNFKLIALGLFTVFIAMLVLGPILAFGLSKLARPIMSRFGLEGRLAADNVGRNPRRTATTANALLIGIFLVSFVTIAGSSMKDYAVEQVKSVSSSDYLISSNGGSLDNEIVAKIKSSEGVQQVETLRREFVSVDNKSALISTLNAYAIESVTDIKTTEGSLAELKAGQVATTDDGNIKIGDVVIVESTTGDSKKLTVAALIDSSSQDAQQVGAITAKEDFDALVGVTAPTVAFIDVDGNNKTAITESLEDALKSRPDISLSSGNQTGQLIGNIFDFMINAVNGLLGMSVLIAVIGIVNTMSLSIHERRKELGSLRIFGMINKRVQRMVQLESVLIALLGTVLGVVLGLFFGWATLNSIQRLSSATVELNTGGYKLILVLLIGLVLGLLAALIPARRSTRIELLEAIKD